MQREKEETGVETQDAQLVNITWRLTTQKLMYANKICSCSTVNSENCKFLICNHISLNTHNTRMPTMAHGLAILNFPFRWIGKGGRYWICIHKWLCDTIRLRCQWWMVMIQMDGQTSNFPPYWHRRSTTCDDVFNKTFRCDFFFLSFSCV